MQRSRGRQVVSFRYRGGSCTSVCWNRSSMCDASCGVSLFLPMRMSPRVTGWMWSICASCFCVHPRAVSVCLICLIFIRLVYNERRLFSTCRNAKGQAGGVPPAELLLCPVEFFPRPSATFHVSCCFKCDCPDGAVRWRGRSAEVFCESYMCKWQALGRWCRWGIFFQRNIARLYQMR